MVARDAVDGGKVAAENNFVVRLLHRHGFDGAAGGHARAGKSEGVQGAVRIESRDAVVRHAVDDGEGAPDDNLTIRLQRDGFHGRAARAREIKSEAGVHAAVQGVEPGNAAAVNVVDDGKTTAND